mmetsp:Transcript_33691/g.64474  ORF Transcript_33691/g.64474 Transcript_33691/m.64474 type:complete len:220 (+) Transcript_33691:1218-1877(+)
MAILLRRDRPLQVGQVLVVQIVFVLLHLLVHLLLDPKLLPHLLPPLLLVLVHLLVQILSKLSLHAAVFILLSLNLLSGELVVREPEAVVVPLGGARALLYQQGRQGEVQAGTLLRQARRAHQRLGRGSGGFRGGRGGELASHGGIRCGPEVQGSPLLMSPGRLGLALGVATAVLDDDLYLLFQNPKLGFGAFCILDKTLHYQNSFEQTVLESLIHFRRL